MPKRFYLIDGYNLMHAAGLAREKYGPGDLERLRNRFLNFLVSGLTAAERERTTVVFDAGQASTDFARSWKLEGMQVLFADATSDADTVIEELLAAHSAPRQVIVVSSDHRLQRAAKRRRAAWVDSDQFADSLREREIPHAGGHARPNTEISAKTSGEMSPEETREWLKVFGESTEELTPELDSANNVSDLQAEIDQIIDEFEGRGPGRKQQNE